MANPSLFLSHGAPTLPLTSAAAAGFLSKLGGRLERPSAVLVISAHWETAQPTVNAVSRNETIHDFYGFPRPLYELHYPALGAPDRAAQIATLLQAAGFDCKTDERRGLDHGAWVPLLLMYPGADIPVLELSVQPRLGPAHHLRLGRALAPLRQDGVLIIGSGSFTHDLSEFRGQGVNDPAPAWVDEFAGWFSSRLTAGRIDELLDYRRLSPFARKNHPTEEHLLPLFVAIGASGEDTRCEPLHISVMHAILRMDVYAFGQESSRLAHEAAQRVPAIGVTARAS
jgi:4,5-DOPA dioxygenase extradiol